MTEARTEKEAIYDEHISPLMAQIIALCKEHKINFAGQFSLGIDPNEDETLWCATVLPMDQSDEEGFQRVKELRRVMYPRALVLALTIFSEEPK